MAVEESAPYIIQSKGYRLESDEFVMDFLYYNKASDGTLTPKTDVADWVVKFTITNESDPTLNEVIDNTSPLIDRTVSHRVRFRAKTPADAGMAIAVTGTLRPYRIRYSREVAGDGAERTMEDIDVYIVKRIPDSANKTGPWLAESFVRAYTEETTEAVPLEIREVLQQRIQALEILIASTYLKTPVASYAVAQQQAAGPQPKLFIVADEDGAVYWYHGIEGQLTPDL